MSGLVRVADTFLNLRGSFKIGPADVGVHSSLIRRKNNKWLMLDSMKLEDSVKAEVTSMTNGGKDIEAILNTHPFHTVGCEWAHQTFPDAKLYGTARHKQKFPNLPWESGLMEETSTQALFSDDLEFSVPAGVDFISSNESVHFSSVLVFHPSTKTLHVDDTFMFIPTPAAAEFLNFKQGTVQLHPTLAGALKREKGASEEFRAWLRETANKWDIKNLCTAHVGNLLDKDNTGEAMKPRLEAALTVAQPALYAHEKLFQK